MKYGEPYGGDFGTVHSFAAYPDYSHEFGHQDVYHTTPMHAQNPHALLQHDFELMSNDHAAPDYHDSQYAHHSIPLVVLHDIVHVEGVVVVGELVS